MVVGHRHVGMCLRTTDPSQEATKGPLVQILSHAETNPVSWTKKEKTLRESPKRPYEPEEPASGLVNHELDLEVSVRQRGRVAGGAPFTHGCGGSSSYL